MAVVTAAPDAVRVVADVIAPWFPVGTDESFEAGAREILAALEAAGWRPSPPASAAVMAAPAAPRQHDAVRVVEDIIAEEVSTSPDDLSRIARDIVDALTADPTLTQHGDGTVTIEWPSDGALVALVSRPFVDGIAAEISALRRALVTIRAVVRAAGYAP